MVLCFFFVSCARSFNSQAVYAAVDWSCHVKSSLWFLAWLFCVSGFCVVFCVVVSVVASLRGLA